MPGEARPRPRAAEAATRAVRERAAASLARATDRLDGLYALLGADDLRDAALLAGLLAEDLDILAGELGLVRDASVVSDRAALGLLPDSDALSAFARRGEARLARLEQAFADHKAGPWRLPQDRFEARALRRVRTALIGCVLLLAASLLLGDTLAAKRRDFVAMVALLNERAAAAQSLETLAGLAHTAKTAAGRPLFAVTGENCTSCGCEGRDLRTVPEGDVCRRKWQAASQALGRAAGASPGELDRLARDPWGSPYLLNENEAESPDFPCLPDVVASAGPNGLAGDADDIVVAVPNALCPGTR